MRLAKFFSALFLMSHGALAQDHALAMHGAPQLLPDFKNYNYASPNALQGRTLKQAQIGSFDSLNPFSIRGNAAKNIRERVFESLLDRHVVQRHGDRRVQIAARDDVQALLFGDQRQHRVQRSIANGQ